MLVSVFKQLMIKWIYCGIRKLAGVTTTNGDYNELDQCQELRQEVRLFKPTCFVEVDAILIRR